MAHGDGIERVTLRERIWAVFPVLNRLMPMKLEGACLVCGSPDNDKSEPHVKCPTPGCVGVFCGKCFLELRKLCTICLSPLDYGDLTDISEEIDSSDDQIDTSRLRKNPVQPEDVRNSADKIEAIGKGEEVVPDEQIMKKPENELQEDILDDDTSSKYSYGYRDEPTEEYVEPPKPKIKFKDVEAQEIRDDVTMQIFSEPLCEHLSSSSDGRMFCFGLLRKKKSVKLLKNSITHAEGDKESDFQRDIKSDSASIADTESWTTEEISDTRDEVLEIEIEDFNDEHSSYELLQEECEKKKIHKRNKFKQFIKTFSEMFLFKKKKEKHTKPFQRKNCKDSIQTGDESEESSSTVSSITDEHHKLLDLSKTNAYSDIEKCKSRPIHKRSSHSHDSCQGLLKERTKVSSKQLDGFSQYPYLHLMKFQTKEIPRHMKEVCNNIKYYEIDESSSSYYSPKEKIEYRTEFSTFSDSRSSVDSDPSRDRRSSTNDACDNDSYIYTSENNDKRYDTHSPSSDATLLEDINFSDSSTYLQYKNKIPNFAVKNNEEKIIEEDKINEDGDEKGLNRKMQVKSDNTQLYRPFSDLHLHGMEDELKILKSEDKEIITQEAEKSWKQNLLNEKFDTLIKDKIGKENANAKKKSCLSLATSENDDVVKKVHKSVGVKESDIKRHTIFVNDKAHNSPSVNLNKTRASNKKIKGRTEHKEHKCSLRRRQEVDQQKLVPGFQPIISRRESFQQPTSRPIETSNEQAMSTSTGVKNDRTEVTDSDESLMKLRKPPNTKDQSTYVRLKSKKCTLEQKDDIGTICEHTDES